MARLGVDTKQGLWVDLGTKLHRGAVHVERSREAHEQLEAGTGGARRSRRPCGARGATGSPTGVQGRAPYPCTSHLPPYQGGQIDLRRGWSARVSLPRTYRSTPSR